MLGILGKILSLPYALPKAGIAYCIDKVVEVAEAEYYNDESAKQALLELQLELEEGAIDEMEYRRREAPILLWLREIKERRKAEVEELIAERKAAGQSGDVLIEMPDELRQ